MNDGYPQPTEPIRYRSAWMIISAVIYISFFGIGLRLLLSIILGYIESDIYRKLFLSVWITLAGLSILSIVTGVEANSDKLVICFLFLKSRRIPWHDIREVHIRHRKGQWCVIKYGGNPAKEMRFVVDYLSQRGRSKCDRLLNAIAKNAQLRQVSRTKLGFPIYKRGEAKNG